VCFVIEQKVEERITMKKIMLGMVCVLLLVRGEVRASEKAQTGVIQHQEESMSVADWFEYFDYLTTALNIFTKSFSDVHGDYKIDERAHEKFSPYVLNPSEDATIIVEQEVFLKRAASRMKANIEDWYEKVKANNVTNEMIYDDFDIYLDEIKAKKLDEFKTYLNSIVKEWNKLSNEQQDEFAQKNKNELITDFATILPVVVKKHYQKYCARILLDRELFVIEKLNIGVFEAYLDVLKERLLMPNYWLYNKYLETLEETGTKKKTAAMWLYDELAFVYSQYVIDKLADQPVLKNTKLENKAQELSTLFAQKMKDQKLNEKFEPELISKKQEQKPQTKPVQVSELVKVPETKLLETLPSQNVSKKLISTKTVENHIDLSEKVPLQIVSKVQLEQQKQEPRELEIQEKRGEVQPQLERVAQTPKQQLVQQLQPEQQLLHLQPQQQVPVQGTKQVPQEKRGEEKAPQQRVKIEGPIILMKNIKGIKEWFKVYSDISDALNGIVTGKSGELAQRIEMIFNDWLAKKTVVDNEVISAVVTDVPDFTTFVNGIEDIAWINYLKAIYAQWNTYPKAQQRTLINARKKALLDLWQHVLPDETKRTYQTFVAKNK
jgi:hypothetical protein